MRADPFGSRIFLFVLRSNTMGGCRHTCEVQPPAGNQNVIFIQTVVSRHRVQPSDTCHVPSRPGTSVLSWLAIASPCLSWRRQAPGAIMGNPENATRTNPEGCGGAPSRSQTPDHPGQAGVTALPHAGVAALPHVGAKTLSRAKFRVFPDRSNDPARRKFTYCPRSHARPAQPGRATAGRPSWQIIVKRHAHVRR